MQNIQKQLKDWKKHWRKSLCIGDLIRLGNVDVVIQKDKLGSPIGGSDDGNLAAFAGGGGVGINNFVAGMSAAGGGGGAGSGGGGGGGVAFDMGDLQQELDQDEFDGINMLNDLIRLGNVDVVIQKDKLGSPIGGSDDGNLAAFAGGGGVGINNFVAGMSAAGGGGGAGSGGGGGGGVAFDMGDLQQELDQDEFDGINMLN
ncbi:hypothetical protein FF38_08360, partial [Lucilia cuprina]